jgi:hypothetical protein
MQRNRRKFRRAELINDVYFEANQQEVLARWTDISPIGVFVQTMEPLPKGEQVKLRLRLGTEDRLYRAVGVVRHSLRWVGMGVEFVHLHPGARDTISRFVSASN